MFNHRFLLKTGNQTLDLNTDEVIDQHAVLSGSNVYGQGYGESPINLTVIFEEFSEPVTYTFQKDFLSHTLRDDFRKRSKQPIALQSLRNSQMVDDQIAKKLDQIIKK